MRPGSSRVAVGPKVHLLTGQTWTFGPTPARGRTKASGFTLIEAMISIAVISILVAAMGSMMLAVGHALPDPKSPTSAIAEAHDAASLLSAELRCARTCTEMTPTAITFTVPDRNGDGVDETIRYYWPGSGGDPLRRVFNGVEADLVVNVQAFNLAFDKFTMVTSQQGQSVAKYYLRTVAIRLAAGSRSHDHVDTTAQLLNQPQVVGP
jgi:prepilin-type N-terminal cleavage/methylation domain-containing protein